MKMAGTSLSVLLIEDNPLDARLIREIMKVSRTLACTIESAGSLSSGLALLKAGTYDAALLDLTLPDSEGINTYLEMHKAAPGMPVIILTGVDDESLALEAMQRGAQDYLVKGQLSRNHLERSLSYALERHKILDELSRSRQSLQATTVKLEMALRSINEELQTAKLVQKALLPQDISTLPGVAVGAIYVPCGTVGGDLYDVIPIDDMKTAFLLLDVAGHGVPAALIAAMAKLSFARNIKKGLSPRNIFERVNAELIHYLPPERFVTAILAIFDAQTRSFSLARAGNPPAMFLKAASTTVEHLSTTGTFIGVFPEGKFGQMDIVLNPGDKVLLYTDGLTECTNTEEKQLGRPQLSEMFLKTRASPPDETAVRLLKHAQAFVGNAPQRDDITLLVLTGAPL
jgi:serine phosphatase RsbU (regulator of sigma subunit)